MVFYNKYAGKFLLMLLLALIICIASLWRLPPTNFDPDPKERSPQPSAETEKSMPHTNPGSARSIGSALNNNIDQELSSLTTEALWKNLLASLQHGKQQIDLENALIERLRKEPDDAIYRELLTLFRQGSVAVPAQQVLVSLLGEVGDYQAAETLISLVNEALLEKADVQFAAIDAINKFSPESWQEHPNTELSPLFESAWQTDNAEFWPAIALVMASIGTPSTLDIFIATLTENTHAERVATVKQAMTNFANPALIPKLADLLDNPATENVQSASAAALANMGQLEAATTLFDWSVQAGNVNIDWVKQVFETTANTTPEFIAYLETNLAGQKFTNPKIKQAVSLVLKDVKSDGE